MNEHGCGQIIGSSSYDLQTSFADLTPSSGSRTVAQMNLQAKMPEHVPIKRHDPKTVDPQKLTEDVRRCGNVGLLSWWSWADASQVHSQHACHHELHCHRTAGMEGFDEPRRVSAASARRAREMLATLFYSNGPAEPLISPEVLHHAKVGVLRRRSQIDILFCVRGP